MIPFRSILAVVLLLLIGSPAWAQSNSDVGGAVPMSDVSGAFMQRDGVIFQSDETRIRMADLASRLARALQEGQFGASIVGEGQSMIVPQGVADLLLSPSRKGGRKTARQFIQVLTEQGVPRAEARSLARTTTGLLEGETINPRQLPPALHAFNAVVDVAPLPFLAQPPRAFVAVRIVLTTLLEGTVS